MIPTHWQETIEQILQKHIQPHFFLLFGSYARGTAREESDLDIAYFSDHLLAHYERFLIAGEIAAFCGVEVDLVDLRQVDTVFEAQIYSTGELLACEDKNLFYKQRMKAYSMYATLNEQRAEILSAIEERGTIYGGF